MLLEVSQVVGNEGNVFLRSSASVDGSAFICGHRGSPTERHEACCPRLCSVKATAGSSIKEQSPDRDRSPF